MRETTVVCDGQVDRLSESHSSGDDLITTCDTVV